MRLRTLTSAALLGAALGCLHAAAAQGGLRVASVMPYERAVPGQIMELHVEGFGERFAPMLDPAEFRVQVTQDGEAREAAVRQAAPVIVREAAPDGAGATMKHFLNLSFVVPRGLRAGDAEVAVLHRGRRSTTAKLTILERPERATLGGAVITTIMPGALPPPPRAGTPVSAANLHGLRFERGARGVELHVRPLADPEDEEASVLVRFRQGGAFYDAGARVVRRERRTINQPGGVSFQPGRDVLEIDVPDLLTRGEAEIEVRLRAAGQTGEPVSMPVTITDAERGFEAPKEAAPRLLAVAPRRVGAGQALMLSVDRRRTLDPDPSKARVVFEAEDGTRQTVEPEMNSAVRKPDTAPDEPVLLIVRPPARVKGNVQVRLINPAREEFAGGLSEPTSVEVVEGVLAPELTAVRESNDADLAPLRRMHAEQARAGRAFREYDPSARYLTIEARGLDYHPNYVRVRLEQEGREAVTLKFEDFSLFTGTQLVVRLPKGFKDGPVRVSVENRGAAGYSQPAAQTFDLNNARAR